MACDIDQLDAIEACRTCGIYYMTTTNYLKPLFQSAVENPEMMHIRLELAQWKVEISETDGLPQSVCSSCIHEFQKIFNFRAACIDTQEQMRAFYKMREENLANVKIKTEIIEPNEDVANGQGMCDFIYVDDFSDDGGEYESVTPFNFPHVPIKEELIEEATVPQETDDQMKSACMAAESASAGAGAGAPGAYIPSQINSDTNQQEHFANDYLMSAGKTSDFDFNENNAGEALPRGSGIECDLCQHISSSPDEHKQHVQRVHSNRDMDCHICGKVFKNSTQSRFKFHLKWHNLNKHMKCPQCGFVCSSRQGLKEHKRAMHSKIYCKICGKGVLAKKMKSHLREHEVVTQFPCEYCSEVLNSEKDRDDHIWQIHGNENVQENAEYPHTVADATNVEEQEDIEEDEEEEEEEVENEDDETFNQQVVNVEIMCAHCDEKFVQPSDLELHVKLRHFKNENSLGNDSQHSMPFENNIGIAQYSQELQTAANKINAEDIEETSDNENDIQVFEDYDNDEEDEDEQEEQQNNDNANSNTQYFNQSPTHLNTANYSNENSNNSEVTNDNKEIETEYIPGDIIPQFACAKCSDTFETVDELREHYKQHQQEQQQQQLTFENSPTKSKFKCNICEKQFDLKFSLNRHLRKHKEIEAN